MSICLLLRFNTNFITITTTHAGQKSCITTTTAISNLHLHNHQHQHNHQHRTSPYALHLLMNDGNIFLSKARTEISMNDNDNNKEITKDGVRDEKISSIQDDGRHDEILYDFTNHFLSTPSEKSGKI